MGSYNAARRTKRHEIKGNRQRHIDQKDNPYLLLVNSPVNRFLIGFWMRVVGVVYKLQRFEDVFYRCLIG